ADRGAVIRWVDDAIVREAVPAERLTLRWQLQRIRRVAANTTDVDIRRRGRLAAAISCVPKCLRRLVRSSLEFLAGLVLYPVSRRLGVRLMEKAMRRFWWISGTLGVVFNIRHIRPQPYRTI